MVLAAGLGLRMRPLTLERPKPLIVVDGHTMLDRALDHLAAAGVELAVVNAHYKSEMIAGHLAGRHRPTTILSHEETALETGGGVRRALPHLGTDPVLVVNADIVWTDGPAVPALARLAAAWDPATMDALLLVTVRERAVGYDGAGDFALATDGRLVRRGLAASAPLVFAGVQMIRPGVFAGFPDGPFSTNLVWDRVLAQGRLFGLIHDGDWYHVGTPAGLAEADARLAAHRQSQSQSQSQGQSQSQSQSSPA
jgi:MurNAc alpha-1-phosphate uridylyltransferase